MIKHSFWSLWNALLGWWGLEIVLSFIYIIFYVVLFVVIISNLSLTRGKQYTINKSLTHSLVHSLFPLSLNQMGRQIDTTGEISGVGPMVLRVFLRTGVKLRQTSWLRANSTQKLSLSLLGRNRTGDTLCSSRSPNHYANHSVVRATESNIQLSKLRICNRWY